MNGRQSFTGVYLIGNDSRSPAAIAPPGLFLPALMSFSMFLTRSSCICPPHQKGTSVIYIKQEWGEDGELRAQMPFQHVLVAGGWWLALLEGMGWQVVLGSWREASGRELGGWQAFWRVPVDIWCRGRVGGEGGKGSLISQSWLPAFSLPSPPCQLLMFKVVRQPILCLKP